jgi:N-acetylmuramoyl-L-alanine amidase
VYDDTSGTAIIQDKTKSLSVVGINEFNVKLKYGIKLSEMELFYKIVQAEAGCEDLKGKILVANVILNRVKSSKFPNTIRGVVMAPGQFQPVTNGKIYTVKVSSETRLAVTMALQGEDYSNGALYFMARSASSRGNVTWFDRALTRVVKHGNHEFFK